MTTYFPIIVNHRSIEVLKEEVFENELPKVLHCFQKDKSTGPKGWLVEFFLGFYELIGDEFIRVEILEAFISTFIAMIPKSAKPSSFKKFKPISLCNCIYKIIVKRSKALFSYTTSQKKIGSYMVDKFMML